MDSCSGSSLQTLSNVNTKSFITSKRLGKSKQRLPQNVAPKEEDVSAKEYQLFQESIHSPIRINSPHAPYALKSKANFPEKNSKWTEEFRVLQGNGQQADAYDRKSQSSWNPVLYPSLAADRSYSANLSPYVLNSQLLSSSPELRGSETNLVHNLNDSYLQSAFQKAEQSAHVIESKLKPMTRKMKDPTMNLSPGLTAIGATDDDAYDPDYSDL
ncbi:hypothetical protein SPOG_04011 [Schizosaccharomyces cryophilus OY26]|uniref:Uncharacterized protein n=1 Tax=Schizosaccharomyces cryophilus (strain OY26 / ATCC MYA-4695 / CBS 11777 / NBRC 106824 / NRRL Y48691) TaxID=653667 RepID=S9W247_SCHCR|nr:uncharacterized protein SPOG_04011 [Schizosaccharomyces cryophilus OY26]EPY54118.1 hypothetical protein SPOG_04011 [Schizosaccharomyces cryophilus OY26]